jgi:hypothetical protein
MQNPWFFGGFVLPILYYEDIKIFKPTRYLSFKTSLKIENWDSYATFVL